MTTLYEQFRKEVPTQHAGPKEVTDIVEAEVKAVLEWASTRPQPSGDGVMPDKPGRYRMTIDVFVGDSPRGKFVTFEGVPYLYMSELPDGATFTPIKEERR
jgi:hypothetical protein